MPGGGRKNILFNSTNSPGLPARGALFPYCISGSHANNQIVHMQHSTVGTSALKSVGSKRRQEKCEQIFEPISKCLYLWKPLPHHSLFPTDENIKLLIYGHTDHHHSRNIEKVEFERHGMVHVRSACRRKDPRICEMCKLCVYVVEKGCTRNTVGTNECSRLD